MAFDGKLSPDEIRVFTRVIDDYLGELADQIESYAEVIERHKADWIANQVKYWQNCSSCLRGLKQRINDLER